MDDQEQYEYAGFWIRVGAAFVDSLLIMAVTFPILLVIYGAEYFASEEIVHGFWDILISYVLPAIAVIWFWKAKQATPGKMAIRAVIVDAKTGHPPSTGQLIVRYLGYFVAILPLCVGLLWVAWDPRKQGWHDKLAGTVVIRKRHRGPDPVAFDA